MVSIFSNSLRKFLLKSFPKFSQWIQDMLPQPGIFRILNYAWVGQATYCVTKLSIPDHLRSGSKSITELSKLTGVHETYLKQIMRTLCGFNIFSCDSSGRYMLTSLSEPLASSGDSWLRNYVLLWGEQLYLSGGYLLEMLKSGRIAFELAHGNHQYASYKAKREQGDLFVHFMKAVTEMQSHLVIKSFEFLPYQTVVDVGGGTAVLLPEILKNNPHLQGTIFDQPHMEALVKEKLLRSHLSDRCSFVGGSFLKQEIPAGADLYLIKHVLHDWSDNDVSTILKNICLAMPLHGILIIIEGVLDERNGVDRILKMRDLEQLIWAGGKVRSQSEFKHLLGTAHLKFSEIRRTAGIDVSLIIARK